MTDLDCRALLAKTNLARLACALDNQPYIVPVQVDLHDAYLYGFATLGRKIEWMRQNPLVCLEFDDITTPKQWSIPLTGHQPRSRILFRILITRMTGRRAGPTLAH